MGGVNIALGMGQQYLQDRQRKQLQEQTFENAIREALMKAHIEQSNPLTQMLNFGKIAELAKTLGVPLQTLIGGGMPQGQGGFPNVQSPNNMGPSLGRRSMPNNGMGIAPYYNQQGQDTGNTPQLGNQRVSKWEKDVWGNVVPKEYESKEIPTAETGKAALAKESIRNIQDVKKMLFPKGTPKSYRRDIAYGSNIALSGLPGVPSNVGFYNPQTVFRKMSAALSGRQLIQTGVAARPEETTKLIRQFAPSGLMSSKAALEGLNELEQFYSEYLSILQTKGLEEADSWAQSQNKTVTNESKGKTFRQGKYTGQAVGE